MLGMQVCVRDYATPGVAGDVGLLISWTRDLCRGGYNKPVVAKDALLGAS